MRLDTAGPVLAQDTVVLRKAETGDAEWIAAACADPLVRRFVLDLRGIPEPYTATEARSFLAQAQTRWEAGTGALFVIADADGGAPLGLVELHVRADDPGTASVGYWLRPHSRGRGAATLAVRLVAAWAFRTLDVARLELITAPENEASQAVAARAGFTREGLLRAAMATKVGRRDSVMFSLLPEDL